MKNTSTFLFLLTLLINLAISSDRVSQWVEDTHSHYIPAPRQKDPQQAITDGKIILDKRSYKIGTNFIKDIAVFIVQRKLRYIKIDKDGTVFVNNSPVNNPFFLYQLLTQTLTQGDINYIQKIMYSKI